MRNNYSTEEDKVILDHCRDKDCIKVIHKLLPHRSLSSIENRRKRLLGIRKNIWNEETRLKARQYRNVAQQTSKEYAVNTGKPWKTTELNMLRDSTKSVGEVAKQLGRSYQSVIQATTRLRKNSEA